MEGHRTMTTTKRKPGRPATGRNVVIAVAIPRKTLAALDRIRFGDKRTTVIRVLLDKGLRQ